MAELKRTKAGPFNETGLVTMQDLTDAFWYYKNENNEKYIRSVIKPVEHAVQHLPKIWVLDTTVDSLCHGAKLAVPGIAKIESDIQVDETVAVFTLKNELVNIGKAKMISKDVIKKNKGIVVEDNKVFMLPGTYPRMQK